MYKKEVVKARDVEKNGFVVEEELCEETQILTE